MFGTWIGWIVKTFDYINRVNLARPLSVYEGTWTHSPPLVAMHLLDRSCVSVGIFLKLHATFPNSMVVSPVLLPHVGRLMRSILRSSPWTFHRLTKHQEDP